MYDNYSVNINDINRIEWKRNNNKTSEIIITTRYRLLIIINENI